MPRMPHATPPSGRPATYGEHILLPRAQLSLRRRSLPRQRLAVHARHLSLGLREGRQTHVQHMYRRSGQGMHMRVLMPAI